MRVLFLGEGDLSGPARYLAAILAWSKIPFDHRPDKARIPKPWRKKSYDAVILSDYRYSSFTPCAREWLMGEVEKGTGLLMIGGWASFTGLVGGYAGSPIEKLLPVTCVRGDDRVQKATGALLLPSPVAAAASPSPTFRGRGDSEITPSPDLASGEGWGEGTFPVVCGYHRTKPKPGTETVAVFRDLSYKEGHVRLGTPSPALVLGRYGRARTAAFLTDCAPHWAGGLVDWGKKRISVSTGPGHSVEVGEQYLRFFSRLIRWTAKGPRPKRPRAAAV